MPAWPASHVRKLRALEDMDSSQTVGVEIWGGVECSLNRVGERWFDQVERTGHAGRASDIELIAGLGVTAARRGSLW